MNGRRATALSLVRPVLVAAMAVLAAGSAQAHDGAPTSFASLTIDGTRVQYSLTTASPPRLPDTKQADSAVDPAAAPARLAGLVARHLRIEADGNHCMPGAADFVPPTPPRLSTTYNIEFRCPASIRILRVTHDTFDFLTRGAHVLMQVQVAGQEAVLEPVLLSDERQSAEFDIGATASSGPAAPAPRNRPVSGGDGTGKAPTGTAEFLPLGIQHILEGWDHLLFLLALVLPGGSLGNLVRIVTAFTVAHSLTLGAAALELVRVPAAPVEALIALSIGWVAAENLARAKPMSRRWAVAFAFGLIHGFGFANVLRDVGLPRDALLSSLLWFNVGIELGQLLVVLLLVPSLAWLRGLRPGRSVLRALSAMILVTSLVLIVLRI